MSQHSPGCRDVRMCPGSGPGVVYSVLCNVYCVMCNVMCNAGGHHSRYQHPAIISSQSDISTSRHPGPGHSYEYSSSLYFVLYTSMYVVSGTSMIQVCSFSIYLLKWILIKHSQWTIYLYEFVISDVYIKYLSNKMFLLAIHRFYLTDGLSISREVMSGTALTPLPP